MQITIKACYFTFIFLEDDTEVSQKEQDLQNRIINLMNQSSPPASVGTGQDLERKSRNA